LFVCLFAALQKTITSVYKIRWKGGTVATEEMIRFWW